MTSPSPIEEILHGFEMDSMEDDTFVRDPMDMMETDDPIERLLDDSAENVIVPSPD